MSEKVLHCWEDGPKVILPDGTESGTTCLLLHNHAGEHEWTPDVEIVVEFLPIAEEIPE